MEFEPKQHDDAVDKVLAALRDAVPPEGMEARIAQRLAQPRPVQRAASRWRDLLTGSNLAGAWVRGALTGAAVASIVIAATLLLHRPIQTTTDHSKIAVHESVSAPTATPVSASPRTTPASAPRSAPCVSPAVPRIREIAPAPTGEKLLAEETHNNTAAPSHPAPALSLTPQERALVRLVHTSDPKDLAPLTPEMHAKAQAQDEADFDRFFATPASPSSSQHNE
ncbi:MAG TPA: hypothetical protein VGN01_15475 [Acidobacteriaceae bacterium]|jgi:hypothetical protein